MFSKPNSADDYGAFYYWLCNCVSDTSFSYTYIYTYLYLYSHNIGIGDLSIIISYIAFWQFQNHDIANWNISNSNRFDSNIV